MILGMREVPRQPKNLDPIDESTMASIGHRIESWQAMLEGEGTFDARQKKLANNIENELKALRYAGLGRTAEAKMLEDDRDIAWGLVGHNEDVLRAECEERIEYYRELRERFIDQIKEE